MSAKPVVTDRLKFYRQPVQRSSHTTHLGGTTVNIYSKNSRIAV